MPRLLSCRWRQRGLSHAKQPITTVTVGSQSDTYCHGTRECRLSLKGTDYGYGYGIGTIVSALLLRFLTNCLNIIGPESTVATDECSVDFFPYGVFPYRSIRKHGVCQWRRSKQRLSPLLWGILVLVEWCRCGHLRSLVLHPGRASQGPMAPCRRVSRT